MPKGLQGHYRIAQLDGSRSSDEFGLVLQEIAHCLADCLMRGQNFLARTPPATIAAAALTILAPYVKGASRELVKTVGEVALEKAKRLRRWLKDRFPGDPVAAKDLSRFEGESIKHASWLARFYRARFAVIFARPIKPWTIGKWGFR
jgi:hypothetical protein